MPTYRRPLFERMRELAKSDDLDLRIAAGEPGEAQRARQDSVSADWIEPLRQREFRVLHRRLTVRRPHRSLRSAQLLVVEQARRNLDVYRLLLPARLRRQRIALWGHGRDYVQESSRFDRWLMGLLTRRADWFFAYTDGGRSAAVADGLPEDRVTVLYNSIDGRALGLELGALTEDERTAFREQWDLQGCTLLAIGGLDPSKRLGLLVAAADLVAADLPGFRLLVAGAGPEAQHLEALAATRPWLKLLGRVDGRTKALALDAARSICNPGRVGLVVIDSFTAAVPILTTSFARHAPEAEYLRDGENSLIVAEEAPAIAVAMRTVLDDDDLLGRLQEACRSAARVYSIERMAHRFVGGLRSCLVSQRR